MKRGGSRGAGQTQQVCEFAGLEPAEGAAGTAFLVEVLLVVVVSLPGGEQERNRIREVAARD